MQASRYEFRTQGYRGWSLTGLRMWDGGYVVTASDVLTGNSFAATGCQLSAALAATKTRIDAIYDAESETVLRKARVIGGLT